MNDKALKIVFMGTPDFSVLALEKLIASRHKIVCVYTQPPRPKGRGHQVQESPVHLAAQAAGIEVRTPSNFKKDEDIAAFMALEADVAIVAAYGLLLPKAILDAPVHGCLNIHASLLPRWRGAAPIHRAIMEGDEETGITIMQMDEGLDTGAMIRKKSVAIRETTTAQSLHDILSVLGASMIIDVADSLAEHGYLDTTPQPSQGSTYARMLKKEEARIDWTKPAAELHRRIRALNPWPGTWCETEKGRVKILEATPSEESLDVPAGTVQGSLVACGNGSTLQLDLVQPESKRPMDMASAISGGYFRAGSVLS